MKLFAFTLDLEPEYAGQISQYEIFNDKTRIENVLSIITSFDIKITVFIVGEMFEQHPDIIKIFEKYDCEFEVHSYSHKVSNLNIEYEIENAKSAYFNYFNRKPKGYRAPQGRISSDTLKLLEKHGFLYDSSIFPSYYPNPFQYLFSNRGVHYVKNSNILEIPLTSITPFRLTLSLSYLKLLGFNFYLELIKLFGLPEFICFNVHLHDFIVVEDSYKELLRFWRFVYGRNKYLGLNYCIKFLKYIKQREYKFCFMSELYKMHKKPI